MSKGGLEQLFRRRQETLEAELNPEHTTSSHSTAKGDHSELQWHKMLRSFLPDRYSIAKGEIFDSRGHKSDQIDLVVYDRFYTPPLVDDEYKVLPVEAVYAAFEIKPILDKSSFDYAVEKARSARTLEPQNTKLGVPTLQTPISNRSHRILTGLLTHQSGVADSTAKLAEWSKSTDLTERLDLVCSLTAGAFEILEDKGVPWVSASYPKTSLVQFCVRLFDHLRIAGTAAPVDLRKYLGAT